MRNKLLAISLLAFPALSGCKTTPVERELKTDLTTLEFSTSGTVQAADKWWTDFNNDELNKLIENGLSGNLGLMEAWQRIKQANYSALKHGASLKPTADFTSNYSTRHDHINEANPRSSESYSFGITAAYELDLWGKISSEQNAYLADAKASKADYEATAIVIASQIAERWMQLISEKQQLEVLKRQLETNKNHLDLMKTRFRNSLATALDIYQQQQTVDQIVSELNKWQASIKLSEHALAVLTGKPPKFDLNLKQEQFPVLPALPSTGVTSELLINRPDIKSAIAKLEAADLRVASAKASKLPAIRLSASANYSSAELSDVFENWYSNFAAGLTAPLFDGEKLDNEEKIKQSIAEQKLLSYRQTVLTALKEVEDALVKEYYQHKQLAAVRRELENSRKTLTEAKGRYLNGLSDYLPVLTALLKVQNLERSIITKKSSLYLYRLQLHKALGGTWTASINSTTKNGETE